MRIAATALVFAAFTLGTPAIAQDPAPAEQKETEQEEEKKEAKKICKRISDMGSRRSTRKCLTREQWLEFNRGN